MAHKSKTQRAKASANRAAKKAARTEEEAKLEATAEEEPQSAEKKAEAKPAAKKAEAKPAEKPKEAKKPRKRGFLSEVRSEMKRVTWPTKQDVLRWSAVVVVALVFFSVFVLVLDNFIVTPILLGISSL